MKIILGLIIIVFPCFAFHIPHIPFDSIDFTQLQLVKSGFDQNYQKKVYFNPIDNVYIKIWDAGYRRSINFLKALQAGFFAHITTLIALIYDDSCRGYITRAGFPIASLTPAIAIDIIGARESLIPLEQQTNNAYITFYHQLMQNTKKTGYVFIDLTTVNLITLHNKVYLIDLESVEPLRRTGNSFLLDPIQPIDYRTTIKRLQSH